MIDKTAPAPEEEPPIRPAPEEDWYLQSLVDGVNGSDAEFGVTLTVGGLQVSGQLVSGHRWFDAFAGTIANAAEEDERQGIMDNLSLPREMYLVDDQKPKYPGFLHLRNAQFYLPTNSPGIPTAQGTWWRGRIASVDGWHLGSYNKP